MHNTMISGVAAIGSNPGPAWTAIGTGDFNNDGKSDIVLRDDTGAVAVWLLDGTHIIEAGTAGAPGGDWLVV